jgi:magnesium transporter
MIVDSAHYRGGKRAATDAIPIPQAARLAHGGDGFVWVGLCDPTDEELAELQREFDLPALAVEDAAHRHQRPKLEEYDGRFFVVLKTARYDDAEEQVHFGEIHIFIGPGYAISLRHGEAAALAPARRRLEDQHPDLLEEGPAAVAWAILDVVVDGYEPVAGGIDADIEEVEEELFARRSAPTERIYFLKREVIEFHRAVAPLLAPLEALERGAFLEVGTRLRSFLRDVADHARRVDEQVNSHRELLTSILEANLALIGVRQNEVVRAISAWAAILAVPTFLASVWGMNYEHMPELGFEFGYPAALTLMAVSVAILYRFFKRIEWL